MQSSVAVATSGARAVAAAMRETIVLNLSHRQPIRRFRDGTSDEDAGEELLLQEVSDGACVGEIDPHGPGHHRQSHRRDLPGQAVEFHAGTDATRVGPPFARGTQERDSGPEYLG